MKKQKTKPSSRVRSQALTSPPAPSEPFTANWTPPEEAISIWLDHKDNIQIGIKKPSGIGYSNPISISDPEQLGKFLFRLLADRRRAPKATIGQHGSPTQAMLEALAKTDIRPRRVELDYLDEVLEASMAEFSAAKR